MAVNNVIPDFKDKTVIVTGASRGIGLAIAELFAAHGANLAICSRKEEDINAAAEKIRQGRDIRIKADAIDLGDTGSIPGYVKEVAGHFGGIDVLVNNAGISPVFGRIKASKEKHFDEIMNLNLKAPYVLCREAALAMRESGGSIVNISSVTGIEPGPGMGLYSVSKASLIMLTKVLAMELGGQNIRVNTVAPGLVKTSLSRPLWITEQTLESATSHSAMKRSAEPDEVADAVLYLASDAASFVNGQTIVVDGGGRM